MRPSPQDVEDFIFTHASVIVRDRRFPLWDVGDIRSELWLLWSSIEAKYGDELNARWRGLLKTEAKRRFPDLYQRFLGNKVRRQNIEGKSKGKRSYVSDLDVLARIKPTSYDSNKAVLDETQREQARAILEMAGRSPRLQKALRANGYRGPFPRVD